MGVTDALSLPRSRPLTYADLESMPSDDGHRYELIDGTLVVTPAPSYRHQIVLGNLYVALRAACPAHLIVLFAPFDVVLSASTAVQPDVVVARRADLTARNLPAAPVLAVEVLSASTRRIDLGTKRLAFAAAGVQSYWVVDPDEPSLVVFELAGGELRAAARAVGRERYDAVRPFPVSVVPADLTE
jgi:Uma2 family endonuclease